MICCAAIVIGTKMISHDPLSLKVRRKICKVDMRLHLFFLNWGMVSLQCVLVSTLQASESAVCVCVCVCVCVSPALGPPSHPSGSSQSSELELFALYSTFPLASDFTCGSVYISVFISQFIPPFLTPSMSTCPFSASVSLFLSCK